MSFRSMVLTGAFLFSGVGASLAQTPLDTLDAPSVSVTDLGFYRITLEVQAGPSGAPAGFWVDWMTRNDYDTFGWPADGSYVEYCRFNGTPTLNTDERSSSYRLGPNGVIAIQLGDLFDETGIFATYSDGLPPGTEYAIRLYALGNGNHYRSADTETFFGRTPSAECTQGFWKNHEEVWPLGCLPMMLGNVSYTQAQLLAIFNTPANGNGLIFLAHQLITTKLNACNGSNTSNVDATIAAADALIGNLVVPPVGSGHLAPNVCSGHTETLDQYNNGRVFGVANCPTPVESSTWGAIKSLYR